MILRFFLTGLLFATCQVNSGSDKTNFMPDPGKATENYMARVGDIILPHGYARVEDTAHSFASWLRNIKLKEDKTVYLYNGERKRNQSAQFAVLDIPLGRKDLQQCADAVMRLRAQYLFEHKKYREISFSDNAGTRYRFTGNADSLQFEKYLEKVFAWCGTLSLTKQLHPVPDMNRLLPGDVLIKGGAPGHAVIVMDVAVNKYGKKIYMLAQSYMPAQDIHLLVNPGSEGQSPWYSADGNRPVVTPEWTFGTNALMRW